MTIKLPSHTTRYFAEQAYKACIYNGLYFTEYKTVQGIDIICKVRTNINEREVRIYTKNAELIKVEPIRKSWLY